MYYGYKKKLTKVDSCRLLFFLCFLCFFPSSPSSFPPCCPFRGAACGKRPVNILRTTSSAFHQTTDQSKSAFVQLSRVVEQFGMMMMMMASRQWNDTLVAMASLLPSVKAALAHSSPLEVGSCDSYFLLHDGHWFTAKWIEKVKI